MQILANGLVAFGYLALVGVGFGQILRNSRFMDFTHGLTATSSAYGCYLFSTVLHWPLAAAAPLGLAIGVLIAVSLHRWLFDALQQKHANPGPVMIGSLGICMAWQSLISMTFGDDTKIIPFQRPTTINLYGSHFTSLQVLLILLAVVYCVGLVILQDRTSAGKQMRAIACDPALAHILGIDVRLIRLISTAVAALGAGTAGIFFSMEAGLNPRMGLPLLLGGAVAALIGGTKPIGALIGALALAFLQESTAWLVPVKWRDFPVFVVLIVFLLFQKRSCLWKKAI